MAKYRVLSIDGGGIRGIVTTVIMQRLAERAGLGGFLDKVDLIAGTSTATSMAASTPTTRRCAPSRRPRTAGISTPPRT